MHEANRKAWAYCQTQYPQYFHGPIRVLEVGSYNVNGSVREYFDVGTYVGVDWRAGPDVDVVCFAHEMAFPEPFDTVISASMLEHDPYWEQSIPKMVEQMKDKGILLLSWGAGRNPPHEHDTAPDKCFHNLPASRVLNLLDALGVYIHEFRYEISFPGVALHDCVRGSDGLGEVVLIGFRDESLAKGPQYFDDLLLEDKA